MNKKVVIEFTIAVLCGVLALVIFSCWKHKRANDIVVQQEVYQLLDGNNKAYSGTVADVHLSSILASTRLIELSDGTKLRTNSQSINTSYEVRNLQDFLAPNDIINKPANSDTVFVERAAKRYYFVLGKTVE